MNASAEQNIFNEALGKPPGAQRAAFLDEACGADASLRARVDRLIAAYEKAGSFLESPPTSALAETSAALVEKPGMHVGAYKLLEQIGEGGMGVVFMAEQQRPVRRRVALKIIKAGMDTRQVVARFEAERQALAMMDHPNIAKVLDAGSTEAGRPYVVMELVRGTPITEYCDHHHLTPRQRLELFVQVCQAVQHAHQKGIIHRDLKPSNVLITVLDGVPVPKVIDFGIAKATGGQPLTEMTLFTRFAEMIGTPLYMSPEQAEMDSGADADTRSDVYSLGVLLYELLTGTTPFDKARLGKAAYDEVRRIIREEEPPRPSTRLSTLGERLSTVSANRKTEPKRLGQMVAGELDWIVMKALEKDRNRRYETANGLAKDVQRYLNDEPVSACPPTTAYRFRKILRRHKKKAAVAGAIAAVLVLGAVGTSVGMVRAHIALGRAQAAEKLAQERKTEAEKAQERAERKAAVTDTVNGFMRGVLLSAQPDSFRRAADVRLVDVLEGADEHTSSFKDRPEAEAQVRATLGDTYMALGLLSAANEQLTQAHAAAVKAEGEESELALGIARGLIFVWSSLGRGDAAALARKTHEIAERKLGPSHELTVDLEQLVASTHQRPEDAATLYRELIRKATERGASNEQLVVFRHNYASVLHDQGKFEEAEAVQIEVIKAVDKDPHLNVVNAGRARRLYAAILRARGKNGEAKALYEKALAFQQEKLGRIHPDTVGTLIQYEGFLEGIGDYREALATAQEILEVERIRGRDNDASYFYGLTVVAGLQMRLGEVDKAVRTINEAINAMHLRGGDVPVQWLEGWRIVLLAVGVGPDSGWKSASLRTNVWSAVNDHLLENPGAGDLAMDAIAWDKVRFRLERWTGQQPGGQPGERMRQIVGDATVEQLRALAEPEPGMYRLSMEVPRPGSKRVLHAESWLCFAPWNVDVFGLSRPETDPAAYEALLKTPPAAQRRMSSLALSDEAETKPGPGASREYYALAATGSIDLPPGRYRFSTSSDDGVRLYVDGSPVIDAWMTRGVNRDEAVLDLAGGAHRVRVEYFQGANAAHFWMQLAPAAASPPTPLPVAGRDITDERRRKLRSAELEGRLTAEVNRLPNTASPLLIRARFLAQRGRFSEAARDYASAVRLDPSDQWNWLLAALVTLQAGEHDQYRHLCVEMLSRFGTTTNRRACEQVVKACTVVPDSVPDLKPVMAIANRGVAPDDRDPPDQLKWRAQAKGMADYRAGHFDAAAEWLAKGTTVREDIPGGATTHLFLAMVEFKRGRASEAEAAMKAASEILDRHGPKSGNFDDRFMEWIIVLHARREAAALLGRPLPPPATQSIEPVSPSASEGLGEVDRDRLFKLTGSILKDPTDRTWRDRAMFFADRGRFELAARDFEKALAADRGDAFTWLNAGPVYARIGDVERYRSLCAEMLRRFGDSQEQDICEHVAKTCSILPDGVADTRALAKAADRVVVPQRPENVVMRPWRELAKGMVEYRLGHFDEAVKWLAPQAEQTEQARRRAIALGFLAMAEFRRGNAEQARAAVRQASEVIAKDGPKGDKWLNFRDWLIALEAHKQAEELFGQSAAPSSTTTGPVASQPAASFPR
jgi:serine/threonine protein kinase/tetratricopeptide (TPR) repeat protein